MRLIQLTALCLLALIGNAQAVTFSPSIENSLQFGTVQTGETKTIRWSIFWINDTGERFAKSRRVVGIDGVGNFDLVTIDGSCGTLALTPCIYDVSFTPRRARVYTDYNFLFNPILSVWVGSSDGLPDAAYYLTITGTAVGDTLPDPPKPPSIPIPAALPLLASGLGALGFIGWRRRREAVRAVL